MTQASKHSRLQYSTVQYSSENAGVQAQLPSEDAGDQEDWCPSTVAYSSENEGVQAQLPSEDAGDQQDWCCLQYSSENAGVQALLPSEDAGDQHHCYHGRSRALISDGNVVTVQYSNSDQYSTVQCFKLRQVDVHHGGFQQSAQHCVVVAVGVVSRTSSQSWAIRGCQCCCHLSRGHCRRLLRRCSLPLSLRRVQHKRHPTTHEQTLSKNRCRRQQKWQRDGDGIVAATQWQRDGHLMAIATWWQRSANVMAT